MRLREIQQQVGQGQYCVDTRAVADAILRRFLGEMRPWEAGDEPQEECS